MIFDSFDVDSIVDCAKLTILPAKNIIADPRRFHGFAYFMDGEATYHFPDKQIKVGPKSFLFLPKNVPYKISRPVISHCIVINFYTTSNSVSPAPFAYSPEFDELFDLFNDFRKIYLTKPRNLISESKSLFYKIISTIQYYEKSEYVPSSHYLKIEPAVKYIQENFPSGELTIDLLAQIAGISVRYLSQEFVKCFKLSPKQYIIKQQLSLARKLLLDSEHSVLEIAINCGFQNEYYFSKLFKEKIGESPSLYRKNRRSQIKDSPL